MVADEMPVACEQIDFTTRQRSFIERMKDKKAMFCIIFKLWALQVMKTIFNRQWMKIKNLNQFLLLCVCRLIEINEITFDARLLYPTYIIGQNDCVIRIDQYTTNQLFLPLFLCKRTIFFRMQQKKDFLEEKSFQIVDK